MLAAAAQRKKRRCELCGSEFGYVDKRRRFCSKKCAVIASKRPRAENAYNWKGGRTGAASGYVKVRAPGHPRASTKHPYVLEHILVMEKLVGRFLFPNERVHHKNGQRADNRPENLELWKVKDPPGVRAADYHCAGCRCDRGAPEEEAVQNDALADARGHWRVSKVA